MGDKTGIEWTEATWNPIVGCSIVSPGCTNCYAMGVANRLLDGSGKAPHYDGTTKTVKGVPVWTGKVALAPDHILQQPLRWSKSRVIFVNSMGDLFHEDVPIDWIDQVFAIMRLATQHTFQVLTKRPERMRAYCQTYHTKVLPNVWLGVSAEDQRRADERLPILVDTPAALRFVSVEPLIGSVDLSPWLAEIDWVIGGGESGRGARSMHPYWARQLRDQCSAADVPFFFKQWGEWAPIRQPFEESREGMVRVGKKAAGSLLDGREHKAMPVRP